MYFTRLSCLPILSLIWLISHLQSFANTSSKLNGIPTVSHLADGFPTLSQRSFPLDQLASRADKRAIYELPNGWIGRFDRYLTLIPVQMASQYLQQFYDQVQGRVLEKWISQPPVNQFTISWNEIQLNFFSPTSPIPWSFVMAFLRKMALETHLGFTGKYDVD